MFRLTTKLNKFQNKVTKSYYSSGVPSVPGGGTGHLAKAINTNKLLSTNKQNNNNTSTKSLSSFLNTGYYDSKLNISHTFIPTMSPNKYLLNIELSTDTTNIIKPATFVCALDVSGSMDNSVSIGSGKHADNEISKFSRIDLVKHSLNTIIHCLRPEDQLGLVTFSHDSQTILPISEMNEEGKSKALECVQKLGSYGQTNLWSGLDRSLDLMEQENNKNNKFTLLLSDGEPNLNPPKGIHNSFLNKLPINSSLSTFGYGYDLDSELLMNLAIDGGGLFSHIPDYTMCNTVFINYLSNALVTSITKTNLNIQTNNCHINNYHKIIGPHSNLGVAVGPVQSDHSRNIMLEVETSDPNNCEINLCFSHDGKQTFYNINKIITDDNKMEKQYFQMSQYLLTSIISEGLKHNDLKKTCDVLDQLIDMINNLKASTKDKIIINQLNSLLNNIKHADINDGQIYKAFSNPDYFNRWGIHFLKYFVRSHQLQVCSNFKDQSLQVYGGKLFNEIRTEVENIFSTIPIPQPSRSSTPFQGNFKQSFYQSTGPCFEGNGIVKLKNGNFKLVKDLCKGDVIVNSDGDLATIICVIKTKMNNGFSDIVTIGNFRVTPWHPVRINGSWKFPSSVNKSNNIKCDYVYNFVLDNHHIITIDDIDAVTLGHCFVNDPVLSHSFFGTNKVIDYLKKNEGWNQGLVVLENLEAIYENGKVVGYKTSADKTNADKTKTLSFRDDLTPLLLLQ